LKDHYARKIDQGATLRVLQEKRRKDRLPGALVDPSLTLRMDAERKRNTRLHLSL
jgi:hypothetical protein